MKRLLPSREPTRPAPEEGARVVELDDDAAGEVFGALSSETTRDVLTAIYETPGTASEIADAVDTSLQNVKYHLTKLEEADLIEVGDTWYSEQGNEMKVYAPTNESVVMMASDERTYSSIRDALSRILGAVGAWLLLSVVVEHVAAPAPTPSWDSGPPSGISSWSPLLDPGWFATPRAAFYLGGLAAIVLLVVLPASRRYGRVDPAG